MLLTGSPQSCQRTNHSLCTEGEALQHHEACGSALVELAIEPGEAQRHVIHSVAVSGKFKGVELPVKTQTTLPEVRTAVTGKEGHYLI